MLQLSRLTSLLFPLLLLAPPAAATPAQTAALAVFQFELVQEAALKATQEENLDLAAQIKAGPTRLEEKFLSTLWPYRLGKTSGTSTDPAADEPPFGKLMFPDAIPDLEPIKGKYDAIKFVKQFDRTLAALVGDAAHPSYLEASRLTRTECRELAGQMQGLYGGTSATWQRAVLKAQGTLAPFCYRASEVMGSHLDAFISALRTSTVVGAKADITATMAGLARDPVAVYNRTLSRKPMVDRIDFAWITWANREMAALVKSLEKKPAGKK
jgi:hypothetical protein